MSRYYLLTCLVTGMLLLPSWYGVAAEIAAGQADNWNPITPGPAITWTGSHCAAGKIVFKPFLLCNQMRGAFNSEGQYEALPAGSSQYQYQEQLFMQYGISDKLEIDAQICYQENIIKQANTVVQANGWGDSFVFVRHCACDEQAGLPHMAFQAQLKLPTGKYQQPDPGKFGADLIGLGSWDPGIGINGSKTFAPILVHADVICSFPQKVQIDGLETSYGNYLNCDLALEWVLPGGVNLLTEANGLVQGDKTEAGQRIEDSGVNSLLLAFGIGWSNEKVQMLLVFQRVMAGKNTTANDVMGFTLAYNF